MKYKMEVLIFKPSGEWDTLTYFVTNKEYMSEIVAEFKKGVSTEEGYSYLFTGKYYVEEDLFICRRGLIYRAGLPYGIPCITYKLIMKEDNITPCIPLPYIGGNTIIKKYEEPFQDAVGNNKALITYIDHRDKKGKLVEKFTMFVKWQD